MKTFLLVLLVSQAAFAEPPADAPVMVIKKGQFAPYDGVISNELSAVGQARRIMKCEAERDELRKGGPNILTIVLIAVAGLVVGGATGYGVAKLVK